MVEDPDIAIERPARSRRRALFRIGVGATSLAVLLAGGLWLARKPIALHFVAQALREKNVAASYEITRIGPRTQRLERLVLGDPRRPDLTADWIEVDLGYSLSGIRVTGLRTGTVVIDARYHDGRLDLGSLDRLIPKSGGEAALPDIAAELKMVKAHLATDNGMVDVALNGVGNLRSGFAGDLNATAPRLTFGDCIVNAAVAQTKVATEGGKARLKGPLAVRDMACSGRHIAFAAPRIDTDLRTDLALSDITAALVLSAAHVQFGDRSATTLSGLVTAKGSSAELRGSASLAAARSSLGIATTGAVKLGGDYAVRPSPRDQDYSYAGTLTAEEIRPTSQGAYDKIEAQSAGTPLAPLAKKLVGALRSASRANRLTASGRVTGEGQALQLLLNGANFSAASGARIAMRDGSRLTLNLPKGDWTLDGGLESGGGGLPETKLAMSSRPGGGLSGMLDAFDYRAGAARLALTPVRFLRSSRGDVRVNTSVTLDGPIGTGGVRGLNAPVDVTIAANGAIRLPRDCVPLRWSALHISTASFEPARLDLCGIGGSQLRVVDPALRGKIGESPLTVAAQNALYDVRSNRFDLAELDARIGGGADPVVLHAGIFDGKLEEGGSLAGTLADGTAVIGTVPLDLGAIMGKWRLADGALALDGALRVTDRQADPRFYPMAVPDAKLTLADGRIAATGTLVATGTPSHAVRAPVARMTIGHDLGSGAGQADFALTDLRFGSAVQPDDLTNMSLGIVANVEGRVEGSGAIHWSSEGVTSSTGTFSTRDMNFAGAFGPVTGFSTTIHFTDLLGLKTAPHQRLTARQVSAGVDVFDGVIDYALLSNEQARIEGGRWPFSGGTLELLPATLNLDARQPRQLTFRVVGLDAAAFVNTLQLQNIDVHGTLDGLFPMIFDANGGRIENGVLVARQSGLPPLVLAGATDPLPACDNARQGGSLAYVGAVSNAQLGTMGKFAFDALKHFNYRCLVVRLDGALDGEFVTQIKLNGINQGEDTKHSWLLRPFLKLPIVFNIRIEAPFRKLLGVYTDLSDPTDLIRRKIQEEKAAKANDPLVVQPADSENSTEGNRK
ncbi:MAG: YdbH domain-containing protein [Sphingobium sp.]|nr:YdbH domain-containing protein [Sphingobium sp.]